MSSQYHVLKAFKSSQEATIEGCIVVDRALDRRIILGPWPKLENISTRWRTLKEDPKSASNLTSSLKEVQSKWRSNLIQVRVHLRLQE